MSAQPLDELFAGHGDPWTEAEWSALPEGMGRVELLDGSLLVSPNPGGPHQRMVRNLANALADAAAHDAAVHDVEVFEGINVRVGEGRIMIPDIALLSPAGLDATIYDAGWVVMVVEVTSPSNAWADRLVKPEAYARAGISHYLRLDLDRGPEHLGAVHYVRAPGGEYAETARADAAGLLVLDRPFAATLDLPALARTTR